jgi:hypothetical protein
LVVPPVFAQGMLCEYNAIGWSRGSGVMAREQSGRMQRLPALYLLQGTWTLGGDSHSIGQRPHRTGSRRVVCGPLVLIGAMNPCPCGWYGDPVKECTCSNAIVSRYQPDPQASAGSPARCWTVLAFGGTTSTWRSPASRPALRAGRRTFGSPLGQAVDPVLQEQAPSRRGWRRHDNGSATF